MTDLESWKQRHSEQGSEPAAALKIWFEALFLYLDESTRPLGRELLQYLTIPFKKDAQWDRRPTNITFAGRLKDARHHHIFHSYAKGTSPDNGYQFNKESWELDVTRNEEDSHGRGWTVAIRSSGADNPRPVYMKKSTKTGLYFVDNCANVYVGVRAPKDPEEEDFV